MAETEKKDLPGKEALEKVLSPAKQPANQDRNRP